MWTAPYGQELWGKPLANDSVAVVVFNRDGEPVRPRAIPSHCVWVRSGCTHSCADVEFRLVYCEGPPELH